MDAAAMVGYRVYPTDGMFSDAFRLSRSILNVVNMSVGYYSPHTCEESVVCADLIQAYCWARQALAFLPTSLDASL